MVRKDVETQQLGAITSLEIEEGCRISAFEILEALNRGYTLYGPRNENEES